MSNWAGCVVPTRSGCVHSCCAHLRPFLIGCVLLPFEYCGKVYEPICAEEVHPEVIASTTECLTRCVSCLLVFYSLFFRDIFNLTNALSSFPPKFVHVWISHLVSCRSGDPVLVCLSRCISRAFHSAAFYFCSLKRSRVAVPLNSRWIGQASYITLVDAGRRVEICNSKKNTFVTTHICGLLQQLHLEPRHIWLAPVGHTMRML